MYVRQLLETDPQGEWILLANGLNTHHSEVLVRLIANCCEMDEPLGEKRRCGVRRFLLRGMEKVTFEVVWRSLANNLLK